MRRTLLLTGDVNLMNVNDPKVPFALIGGTLRQADVLFGNLECCFYEPAPGIRSSAKDSTRRSRPLRPPSWAAITRSATPTT